MHLQEQMLRHKAQYGCAVSCFGSRDMLKNANEVSGNLIYSARGTSGPSRSASRSQRMTLASLGDCCFRSPQKLKICGDPIYRITRSERRNFSPTRGTSGLGKKDCLNFPEKSSCFTKERKYTRK